MFSWGAIPVLLLTATLTAAQGSARADALPEAPSAFSSSRDSSSRDAQSGPLPAALSTTQQEAGRQRFRSQLDAVPGEPHRLTAQDKFHVFVEHTNSPFTFAAAGVSAGLAQATNSSPGFNRGWAGYGKRYGAALADSETSAFFTKFLIPVMARQDPRFKRNGREPFLSRLFGAASQVVNTVDDDGDPAFNYSQVLGTVVSASIANAYYPPESRGMRRTANRAVNGLGGAAGANVLREFWPDVKRLFVRRKVSRREVEALNWRTGSQPSIVPEAK
ncbi:MAG: hypothetical protein M3P27_07950 [Acidobacteriota bacterium]|nr:hypothetical protein [Acidobacteriota bacterium]